MEPSITTLIAGRDNLEVVRDQIAGILLIEQENQQNLADSDPVFAKPSDWKLRVYTSITAPWNTFIYQGQQANPDFSPVINVSPSSASYDASKSNPIERQFCTAIYNIDCYGYGTNVDTGNGHVTADAMAECEALRAYRLVRKILMAGAYTYLGLRGTVSRRWPQSMTVFQPTSEDVPVDHVVAVRLELAVDFNEFSPQVEGVTIESIFAQVTRDDATGQVLLSAEYKYNQGALS